MHSIAEVGTNVPAFLAKLWKLVEANEFDKLICWSENGDSFIIHNQAQFCRELLPLYYKHNNMASFVRQLNMYGFHKKVNVESGGLKVDRDEMEFAHPFFVRDQPQLLERIKRKIAETGRGGGARGSCPDVINKVLGDVKQVKGRQENLDGKLTSMKRENEALWRELAVLRQKHLKQQQIVNKLIQFLLTVVQSPNRLNVKRRVPPLMLTNDKEHHHHHHHHRHHKHHQGEGSPSTSTSDSHISLSAPVSPTFLEGAVKSNDGKGGPTIHELDPGQEYSMSGDRDDDIDAEEEEVDDPEEEIAVADSPPSSAQQTSFGNVSELNPDLLLNNLNAVTEEDAQAPSKNENSDIALFNSGSNSSDDAISKWADNPLGAELDSHVDQVQNEIDCLKELLQSDNYSLDANTLLSLFTDDPVALNMGLPAQEKEDMNAVIACNPSLFDLTEDNGETAAVGSNSLYPDMAANQSELNDLVMDFIIKQGSESDLMTPESLLTPLVFAGPPSKKRKH
ncbi:Hypothetical predicted protein [Cloeon dipterum]|uniref:HSF-type DNA-binding domain-containing protein n=2 Tax=Cloeon dipterum TaxID=197152 RepID=A0A8S1D3N3_9INSE|nr:Hypothetical predicted protein [Cloeon dipterum]